MLFTHICYTFWGPDVLCCWKQQSKMCPKHVKPWCLCGRRCRFVSCLQSVPISFTFSYKVTDVMPLFVSKPFIFQKMQWLFCCFLFCFVVVFCSVFFVLWFFFCCFVFFWGGGGGCLFVFSNFIHLLLQRQWHFLFFVQTFYFPKHAVTFFSFFFLFFWFVIFGVFWGFSVCLVGWLVFPISFTFSYNVNDVSDVKPLFCVQTFYFPKHTMTVLFLFCFVRVLLLLLLLFSYYCFFLFFVFFGGGGVILVCFLGSSVVCLFFQFLSPSLTRSVMEKTIFLCTNLLSTQTCNGCFVLFCFVLFCFVLFCFVLFCFVLFCFVLFLFRFVSFCFILLRVLIVCLFVCLFFGQNCNWY